MSSSSLHYDRIEQIIGFFLQQKLTLSQRSLLISDLLYYERLSGLRLIQNGDSVLTVLEEDVRTLHTTSSTAPLFHSEQKLPDSANHERMIDSLLDAQCASASKILREDTGILHPLSAGSGLKDQANVQPKSFDHDNQPCSLQKSIPQQA